MKRLSPILYRSQHKNRQKILHDVFRDYRAYSLWHKGVFTGAVGEKVEQIAQKSAIKCIGKAGSACLMHTRVLHGSLPNKTDKPRRLFIACYASEDAIALDRNHIPSKYDGEIVRGVKTGKVRTSYFNMELPE